MKTLCIITLILVGCGSSAEASPDKATVKVRTAIIEEAVSEKVLTKAWGLAVARLQEDVTGNKVRYEMVIDREESFSGPELSLVNFWNGKLLRYWWGKLPIAGGTIRLAALSLLEDSMYGGVVHGSCQLNKGFAVTFLSDINIKKDALVIAHELGHLMGADDIPPGGQFCPPGCTPQPFETKPCCIPAAPTVMDLDAGNRCRNADCKFSGISKMQILRCLNLKKK